MTSPADEADPAEPVEDLAYLDDLTGLRNRRFLAERLRDDWRGLQESHAELTLLILDLDGFKEVNDRHGHLTGDRVLCDIARILERSFRSDDAIVRYGGDEFVVVLPGVGAAEARSLAERARRVVDEHTFRSHPELEAIRGEVSFSVGVATAPPDADDGEELLAVADRRLFEEKRQRKGRQLGVRVWRVTATLLALILAGALGLAWWWTRALPPEVEPASPSPAVLAARTENQRHLGHEVERLEGKIEQLLQELEAERTQPRREELAEELAAVEDRLSELAILTERVQEQGGTSSDDVGDPVVWVESAPEPVEDPVGGTPTETPVEAAPATDTDGEVPDPQEGDPPSDGEPSEGEATPPSLAVRSPRLIEMPPPRYPGLAARLRREATVEVGVTVDVEGRVGEAVALSGPRAHGFRDAALEAVRLATFEPGQIAGETVESSTILVVRFRLRPEGSGGAE